MRRFIMTMLITLFIVPLFGGCAVRNAEGRDPNYPPPKKKHIATQRIYPNELLRTSDYIVTNKDEKAEWFEPDKFIAFVERSKLVAPVELQDQHKANILALKPMQVQMSKEINKKKSAFYALYFRINSGVNINFQKGGLILTFRDPQGNTIDVPDKGCLFVSYKGTKATLHDSSKKNLRFNRKFNNEPDYNKMGNLVCVRLPPQYENWELVSLRLEPQRISMLK